MRRRRDLTGWILMGVLMIAAMALIFYILLLRAQHLASMEDRRENPDEQSESHIQRQVHASEPVVMHVASRGAAPAPYLLVFDDTAYVFSPRDNYFPVPAFTG